MKCSQCHSDNPRDSRFCRSCGSPLSSDEKRPISPTKTFQAPIARLTKGTLFAGRYEIIEELGSGGMGRVYKVLDKEINEEVALKLLNPDIASDEKTIERFRNELKYARKISHKNVCRMYDINREKDSYFITMEYVPGGDLKTLLNREGPLSEDKAISIAEQTCAGLAEAHRLGVIHRDLKPQNIMIDRRGNAHIMDFGIARSHEAKGITEAGTLIGTPDYMSPEQVEGKDADERSDLYSMGAMLYEMVTGKLPFEGKTALSIAFKHKTEIPLDPRELNSQISEQLSAVILNCLEKEREKRYQTAEELRAELRAAKEGLATHVSPPKPGIPAFLIESEEETRIAGPVFVAREQEIDRLGNSLRVALSGKGRVVFVTGEVGSGKTALVQEFLRRAQEANSDLIVAKGKCNAHTGIGDPYLPFIEIMGFLTGDVEAKWRAGAMSREHALRLWNLLPLAVNALLGHGQDLVNIFISGAALVSRSEMVSPGMTNWLAGLKKIVERKASLPADSTLQQSNLFEQYTRVLQAIAQEKPLLLILDDLQWVDAGSASLLFHLGRRIEGSRILIVGAYRQAEVALGRGKERHPLEPVLNELKRDFGDIEVEVGKAESRRFVDDLIDSEPNRLSPTFHETLYKQTKGLPLFTVELLRNMQERGALVKDKEGKWTEGPELNWDALPARVDAVIEERIGRLNERLRELLTVASVEGEEFTAEVVARVQEAEVHELVRLLSRELDKRHHLVSAKGIRQLEKQRLSLYLFQHILFQRYLYNSLDKVERAHLHEEVGNVLETLYGEQTEEVSVQLSRHFLEAGIVAKAVDYLQKAGDRAVRLSANEEAIAHYKKALELLPQLPESPERVQRELGLQLAYAVPIQAAKGFGGPELEKAIVRARELCEQIGDTPQLFTALVQLAFYYGFGRAEYRTAFKLQERVIKLAEQSGDPLQSAISSYVSTWALLNVGELVKTRDYTKMMNALYEPEKYGFLAHVFGYDLGVVNRGFGAWALWFLGYPDQALEQYEIAMEHARKLGHPHTLAFALVGGLELFWFRRDIARVHRYLEELIPLANEKGFIYWQAHAILYQGERLILEGKLKEGIAQMRQGLGIMKATGTLTCFTRLLGRMADACLKAGAIDEGLSAVTEAAEIACKYDERYFEAELYRLKGELLLRKGQDHGDAMNLFLQAIEVSRQQQAKSLELRAVMSLSRLLDKQGKKTEARKQIEDIYGWFSEGFDTPDLKEAGALLEQLS